MGQNGTGIDSRLAWPENETQDVQLIRAELRLSEYVNNAMPGIWLRRSFRTGLMMCQMADCRDSLMCLMMCQMVGCGDSLMCLMMCQMVGCGDSLMCLMMCQMVVCGDSFEFDYGCVI